MQSLDNKIDELLGRLNCQRDIKNCNILCFTESWLNDDNINIQLAGYTMYRVMTWPSFDIASTNSLSLTTSLFPLHPGSVISGRQFLEETLSLMQYRERGFTVEQRNFYIT